MIFLFAIPLVFLFMVFFLKRKKVPNDLNASVKKRLIFKELIGQTGFSLTDLNLKGKISLNGHVYEALSKTGFVEKNSPVIVTEAENDLIIVKKII